MATEEKTEKVYDVIVVGAGSSGGALAGRLSEDPNRKVLLIEAGPYFPTVENCPPAFRYAGVMRASAPDHPGTWKFHSELVKGSRPFPLPRGKLVGGGSAVNGALFTWGLPSDFQEWALAGNELWAPKEVWPYFRRVESDLDYPTADHGTSGPVPVRRASPEEWPEVASAFVSACRDAGHLYDQDMNAPQSVGVGALPVNVVNGVRMNTALTYLAGAGRRKNLTILPETVVRRVTFDGRSVRGVLVTGPGGQAEHRAGQVVLSAGAIKSAQLLMLSGIGDADHLRTHGISVLQHSPGVGSNFTDHCSVRIWYGHRRGLRPVDPTVQPGYHVGLHYSSPASGVENDMMILPSSIPFNRQLLHGAGLIQRANVLRHSLASLPVLKVVEHVRRGWHQNLNVIVLRGDSRGLLRLRSSDAAQEPVISHNYLADAIDRARLRDGVRLGLSLLQSSSFAELRATAPLRGDSDNDIDRYVINNVGTTNHLSSTCRMGPPGSDHSVVDQRCRVYGVEGLRVVDTSVMPTVVRRGPNATAMMIGDRASAFFK